MGLKGGRTRPHVAAGVAAAVAVLAVAVAAAAWFGGLSTPGAPAGAPTRAAAAPPAADGPATALRQLTPPQALAQRCQVAMQQGVCSVINDGRRDAQPPADAASRVFVAGAGEVSATVYAELRRFGDEMCGEVERQCSGAGAWDSPACRVARALYPEVR